MILRIYLHNFFCACFFIKRFSHMHLVIKYDLVTVLHVLDVVTFLIFYFYLQRISPFLLGCVATFLCVIHTLLYLSDRRGRL